MNLRRVQLLTLVKQGEFLCKLNENTITLNLDHSFCFDDSQFGGGHTGVVACVANVLKLQHIFPDGQLIVGGEVSGSLSPLDKRHGASHSHTGDVQTGSILHFILCLRSDGEVWRHSTNCKKF